jgi:hypothetical protein
VTSNLWNTQPLLLTIQFTVLSLSSRIYMHLLSIGNKWACTVHSPCEEANLIKKLFWGEVKAF